MRNKISTALEIVGLLAGFAYTIYKIWNFVFAVNAIKSIEYVNEEIFPNFQLYTTAGLMLDLLFIVIALVVGVVSLIYVMKATKAPHRNYYKTLIIANVIGLITPFFIGSIILLIDSAIKFKNFK